MTIHNENSRVKILVLAKLRDFLLPLLMNGQVHIPLGMLRSVKNAPNPHPGIPSGMQPKHFLDEYENIKRFGI